MSSAGPQQSEGEGRDSSRGAGRGLRNLPGFTTAAVVFLLIVLLGAGGAAIAKWNQSATVAIAITAGAAPTTSAPPAGPGNISTVFTIAQRPGTVPRENFKCIVSGNSGNFIVTWTAVPTPGVKYVVLLKSVAPAPAFQTTSTVTLPSTSFDLDGKVQGTYSLRIQAISGANAGDPMYMNLRNYGKDNSGCDVGAADGSPPLGAFTVNAAPGSPAAGSNILQLGFSASQATSYLVSIESATSGQGVTKVRYGAEFTTNSFANTLTFPPRVTGPNGTDIETDYYGNYSLRIMPLKLNTDGSVTAGDPVTKVIRYYANYFAIGDY